MTRIEQLNALREEAVAAILASMRRANAPKVYAFHIDEGWSPVILPDQYDTENTFTLDSIEADFDNKVVYVDASSSSNSTRIDQEYLPVDVLINLADWLEANESTIRDVYRIRIELYGNSWDMAATDPRTDNSRLCVSIDEDEVWVDETDGKCFLKHKDSWYEKSI